jgi:hypothetical protein
MLSFSLSTTVQQIRPFPNIEMLSLVFCVGFGVILLLFAALHVLLVGAAARSLILFAGGSSAAPSLFSACMRRNAELACFHHQPRYYLAGAAAGDLVLFAGGRNGTPNQNTVFAVVDIYNTSKRSWLAPITLSQPRADLAGAATADLLLFAGGFVNNTGKEV